MLELTLFNNHIKIKKSETDIKFIPCGMFVISTDQSGENILFSDEMDTYGTTAIKISDITVLDIAEGPFVLEDVLNMLTTWNSSSSTSSSTSSPKMVIVGTNTGNIPNLIIPANALSDITIQVTAVISYIKIGRQKIAEPPIGIYKFTTAQLIDKNLEIDGTSGTAVVTYMDDEGPDLPLRTNFEFHFRGIDLVDTNGVGQYNMRTLSGFKDWLAGRTSVISSNLEIEDFLVEDKEDNSSSVTFGMLSSSGPTNIVLQSQDRVIGVYDYSGFENINNFSYDGSMTPPIHLVPNMNWNFNPETISINISGLGIQQIVSILPSTLETLNINDNTLTMTSDLVDRLILLTELTTLGIANCSLGFKELDEIYAALPNRTGLSVGFVSRSGNPGIGTDDTKLATDKNWMLL